MEALTASRIAAALAAFVAVALAVLALALFWEGVRGLLRRRAVARQLRRLAERSEPGEGEAAGGLLREEKPLPGWLAPIAGRLPRLADLQLVLQQARSPWSVGTFLLLTLGLGLGFGVMAAILGLRLTGGVIAAAVGALLPYLLVARRRRRRVRKFEEQFPDAIDLLARAARAGHAFQTGLREVAEESEDPLGEEFRQVFEEQKFGLPLAESLVGLADRIDLVDLRMFVTSVVIQKETGGNLAENLDNLGRLIRERFRFQRQIKVHTAHGRMTGGVLAAAPLFAILGLSVVAPDYIGKMFTETAGRWMLALAVTLQIVGFLVIRRMSDLEF
ncbi:MAG: type II secretion system F family protein [Thermoanaerobaculia bacterium]